LQSAAPAARGDSGAGGGARQVGVTLPQEVLVADREGPAEVVQQRREAARIGAVVGDALELDEVAQAVDPVEVDPHAFEGEEAAGFLDDDGDAEDGRERVPQTGRVGHLDEAVAALLVPGEVRSLVGDQVGGRVGFLTELQPPARGLEVGVALAQRPLVLRAELAADLEGPGGIAIERLQLQVSARSRDPATLSARRRGRPLTR
jgi:hypothetical protein